MKNILNTILNNRKKNFSKEKTEALFFLPKERQVPLVPFFKNDQPFIICELKRASPSKGDFGVAGSYEKIFKEYLKAGVSRFSVLTERKHFKGTLYDLYRLKKRHAQKAFLRKDFLYCPEDIRLSYLAGADAVLLIAEMLTVQQLTDLIIAAQKYNLQTLCEVHSKQMLEKVLALEVTPTAIGINARNLKTFAVDPNIPLQLRPYIPEHIKTVFESGVEDNFLLTLAGNAKFDAVLIGQTLMQSKKRIALIKKFKKVFQSAQKQKANFFTKLYSLKKDRYIKICGLTNLSDAKMAKEMGADVLGMILASSPRKTNLAFIKKLANIKILKAAVVINPNPKLITQLKKLIAKGLLDAVQFHGKENKKVVHSLEGNAYKVISPKHKKDLKQEAYLPTVLYDAVKERKLLKGKLIPDEIRDQLQGKWIAGGLNPKNVKKIIKELHPQLIDVSSGVEESPGVKDLAKMKRFFKEVNNV